MLGDTHDPRPELYDEIRATLAAVERGEVTVTLEKPIGYCGNEHFTLSNGWRIVVFNDCDEWDYIDCIHLPDGRTVEFNELYDHATDIATWTPVNSKWGGMET